MAIALLGHLAAAGNTTFTSGAGDTTGASLLVVAVTEASPGLVTLSDSKGNTWLGLTEQSGTPSCRLYYAVNPLVGSAHTFTLTGASMMGVLSAAWFSGVPRALPFDLENGAQSAAFVNAAQPGSILPGSSNALVLSAFAWLAALTVTSVTGMTLTDQTNFAALTNYGGGLAYAIQSVPGALNPTWNFAATVGGSAVIAAFKAAFGGSPVDGPMAAGGGAGISPQRM